MARGVRASAAIRQIQKMRRQEEKMKKIGFCIMFFLFFGLLVTGARCEEKKQSGASLEDVKKKAAETEAAASAYTEQKKEEYQKQIEAKIKDVEKKMDEMEAKGKKMKGEALAEWNRQMDRLQAQKKAATRKLDELKKSSGQGWENLKEGMNKAVADLEKSFHQMLSHYR
jgi:DNA repair exonuclease SbcCD ATPase subunit